MKDLEKIKSEDLGCQVQSANPGNFAIEQEVAQLVGATVPAPTQPSADDARELGAQLLVFLRRALLPIRSALRTALADIYAHLDSRCTDYTPAAYAPYQPLPSYDPMGTPPTPRTLPNLLTAITAFSARKISGVPDAPDGISLVHLIHDAASIETLTDDTEGWTMVRNNLGIFTGLKHLQLGCDVIDVTPTLYTNFIGTSNYDTLDLSKTKKVYIRSFAGCVNAPNAIVDFSGLEEFYGYSSHHSNGYALISACANESLDLSKLRKLEPTGSSVGSIGTVPIVANSSSLKDIDLSSMAAFSTQQQSADANKVYYFRNCPNVESINVGTLTSFNSINFMVIGDNNATMQKLVNFEIGAGTAISLNLAYWNPTYALQNQLSQFLQNFKEHIALRLTANGSGKTLTLSQAVRDAIHAAEATYGIEAIIVTQKGWRIQPDAS